MTEEKAICDELRVLAKRAMNANLLGLAGILYCLLGLVRSGGVAGFLKYIAPFMAAEERRLLTVIAAHRASRN